MSKLPARPRVTVVVCTSPEPRMKAAGCGLPSTVSRFHIVPSTETETEETCGLRLSRKSTSSFAKSSIAMAEDLRATE